MAAPLISPASYAAEAALPEYLHAIVDIGSNGVRFSISSLHPLTSRILPTLFSDRAPISLYDAQFSTLSHYNLKAPISPQVIAEIITTLHRFKNICHLYRVPQDRIRIVATEATRTAENSAEFRQEIHDAVGWKVELLSKQDEGRIGALGIASSFHKVEGLVMDLGGGSTQLSWMISKFGEVATAQEAVSMPFGAAALTKKLKTALDGSVIDTLAKQIQDEIKKAVETLNLPDELKKKADQEGGYTLYLSGGGFRGFGYLLLAEHEIRPYPMAIINGFSAKKEHFYKLANRIGLNLTAAQLEELENTFRISERRAGQVPAVAFLIRNLLLSLPQIKDVVFCQGGVREGCLYETLPVEIRRMNPLVVATEVYRPSGARQLLNLINDALPPSTPEVFWAEITPALVNLLTFHGGLPKESRAAAGLHFTTTGLLASTHGLTHKERGLLGLTLCARWGGEIAETGFKERLESLVGEELAWWAKYVGAVAGAVGSVFPVGIPEGTSSVLAESPVQGSGSYSVNSGGSDSSRDTMRRRFSLSGKKISFFARDQERGKHSDIVLKVRAASGDPDTSAIMVKKAVDSIEKVGKKKNCQGYRKKIIIIWETAEE